MSDEAYERFDCFGGSCAAYVTGAGAAGTAADGVALVRRSLTGWHERFSRFLASSELSLLNADAREEVPASPLMVRLAQAVAHAGALTGGLVDATLVHEIRAAGYTRDIVEHLPLDQALSLAPPRTPATPAVLPGWSAVHGDVSRGTVNRPPGVQLDSGGLAKGLFADVLAALLADHESFAVDCSGDLAVGGARSARRAIEVSSPFDGSVLHTFALARGGVATSGIGRRAWLDRDGRPAHHLLDPGTGAPAFTGVVQATALARSALTAEIRAKAAVLSGPRGAARWLHDGGVVVLDDGSHHVIEPPPTIASSDLSRFTRRDGPGGAAA
jgi:thiamine biosynthesis lipoprotein